MLDIGPEKILFLAAIAVIFVGPKKMPELARTVGRALRELRRVEGDVRSDLHKALTFIESPGKDPDGPPAGVEVPRAEAHSVIETAEELEPGPD